MEGYAQGVIIPSQNLAFPAHHDVFSLDDGKLKENKYFHRQKVKTGDYPNYYENTHMEALEAKRMMDAAGHSSAIFITAPYQIRRVRIICANVFQPGNYRLTFVGSAPSNKGKDESKLNWKNTKHLVTEYVKILGFLIYHTWETSF